MENNIDKGSGQNNPKFLTLDIVFYGGGLNYDQGGSNSQELKKITMYDGSTHILVSRYAIRYSMLENASKLDFKLAGPNDFNKSMNEEKESNREIKENSDNVADEENNNETENNSDTNEKSKNNTVIQPKATAVLKFPEFDLFGYMITTKEGGKTTKKKGEKKGDTYSRVSPVKISHAISLTPYNFDSQSLFNLGVTKRAGGIGSDPFTTEEFYGFYVYNITIDLDRIGVFDNNEVSPEVTNEYLKNEEEYFKREFVKLPPDMHNNNFKFEKKPEVKKELIKKLLKVIMYLKRDIKGRREDLSPWLVVGGKYNDSCYDSFIDKITLMKKTELNTTRGEEHINEGNKNITKISYIEEKSNGPKFVIGNLTDNSSKYIKTYALPGVFVNGKTTDFDNKEKFIEWLLNGVFDGV